MENDQDLAKEVSYILPVLEKLIKTN